MKLLTPKRILIKLLVALAFCAASVGAQAATYTYNGVIGTCTGICDLFTDSGETAKFSFDSAATGPGDIAPEDITAVRISLSTPPVGENPPGELAFVDGTAISSSLTITAFDNITGGGVTLQAAGATTGILAAAIIDVPSGTWTAYLVNSSSGELADEIASGSGSFAPVGVPVPAAAWLFGSALLGLAGIGRRRRA